MQFIFSTPVLIRHLWQLKIVVFLHRCLICTVPLDNLEGDFLKRNGETMGQHIFCSTRIKPRDGSSEKVNRTFKKCFKHVYCLNQGILTEGEDSVQLTSSFRVAHSVRK
jgi:hypothetical protein